MADHERTADTIRIDAGDAAELLEVLGFISDWLDGPDATQLDQSLTRFVGHPAAYSRDALQADLDRLAFLLGDDSDRLFGTSE
ncbi:MULTISPECIES: hypothetical protein [Pseudonocardia]|uniref:Uncharacterized protein n=2 Tax=Pseudonocardia TaxID=1847 RepID=A0A1Y2MM04_PSEAH|nr:MULTISPECIES: hypothetical protein [Pseudonocardia]OSY36009.1 hypothetical protein BG845_05691 [Pseudonocardia autotrophica]TDN65641.1 hypothetical protein C8E95_7150 [Pseudonocardia autotrophica]BBG05791.1 hypothetical protein Pdca_70000 [Pseudonocardia autotrophica]GEC27045.1 hypothetical protein PSA01_40740 [Pseudonocardia saturnea]